MRVKAATIIVGMCGVLFSATQVLAASVSINPSINIDFGAWGAPPSNAYGGAAGQAGTWNQVGAIGPATRNLVDINGVSGSLSLSLTGSTIVNSIAITGYTGDERALLNDFIYTERHGPWSFSIDGLGNGAYDVYAYAPAHVNVGTGDFSINGIAQSAVTGSTGGTVDLGVEYLVARTIVSNGTMSFVSSTSLYRSGLAGLQISNVSAIPLPPAAILFGTALLGLAGLKRRKRTAA